ncbi:hypothetical protein EGR_09914 [Echinococcus granulosus]|uniref:Uncharacterized protein n=1 Tax=Echinococcus granulosus TaxID=6210 RepID=W6U3R1_ECHGR|nr:hypothetical protein EGR_09914 [Echinococcus granulosus]EUB55221.1 hypothetical protein EGR_09914 [Echinococcus granulosus]
MYDKFGFSWTEVKRISELACHGLSPNHPLTSHSTLLEEAPPNLRITRCVCICLVNCSVAEEQTIYRESKKSRNNEAREMSSHSRRCVNTVYSVMVKADNINWAELQKRKKYDLNDRLLQSPQPVLLSSIPSRRVEGCQKVMREKILDSLRILLSLKGHLLYAHALHYATAVQQRRLDELIIEYKVKRDNPRFLIMEKSNIPSIILFQISYSK